MRRGHYDDGDDADVRNRGDGCGAGGTSKRLKRSGGGGATDEPSTSASSCVVFEASTNENENENETIAMIAKTTGDGEELMSALLAPLGLGEFRERFLDARPAVIRGGSGGQQAGKFSGWFDGLQQVEAYVRSGRALEYGRDVDVTSYVDGKRRTHNRNGDDDDDDDSGATTLENVDPDVLMRRFRKEKCSLRLLHPQTWHDATWEILATLEKFWQCACGCNVYVTPADSQGFAPHYDDIDAFVLQLEGAKRWRVYEPFADDQYPRLSSRNYTQEEVSRQRVLFDGTLEAGDVLYMPRGTIHQAECASGTHSIHATISTNQANAPADALEVLIPNALAAFIQENVDSRRNLRVGWAEAAFEEKEENDEDGVYVRPRTQQVRTCVERFAESLLRNASSCSSSSTSDPRSAFVGALDDAVDSLEARFMLQRLPPPATHLYRGVAENTGATAAAELRSGARKLVARQMSGGFVVIHDGVHLVVYHPFQNARDGSHHRVFNVVAETNEAGRLVIPKALEEIAEEMFFDVGDEDAEDGVPFDARRRIDEFLVGATADGSNTFNDDDDDIRASCLDLLADAVECGLFAALPSSV